MKFRVLLFVAVLSILTGVANAQMRSSSSVIVKLRSAQSVTDAALRTKIQSFTGTALTASHAFQRSTRQNTQSFTSNGLERIYVIPLSGPRDAQSIASQLAGLAEIEYAQPNYIYSIDAAQANDPDLNRQWYIKNVRADQAWEITTGDSSIAIGVLDTGVDWLHPDLSTQFKINKAEDRNGNGVFDAWPSNQQGTDIFGNQVNGDIDGVDQDRNGYTDDVIGYDFVDQPSLNFGDARDRDPIPSDEHGHGTQVSGVVSAKQNNAKGISGVAPGCRIVALRAFDATGNAEDDDIASAIVYAVENGVRILNLSYGDVVPSMLQRDAIRYAVDQGVTVFASSGNEGGFDRHYPSDFNEVISVGATTNIPYEDILASLTTTGEGMDILAPGTDIYTTDLDNGYKSVNGTSFSSPIAAAIGALLLSKDTRYTPAQIKGILASTARDLGKQGFDPETANGRVDALSALNYRGTAAVRIVSPHTNDGLKVNQQVQITGGANATLFSKWVLSFATALDPRAQQTPDAQRGWVTIAESNSQQLSGTLGEWNTTGLELGLYTLRLALYSNDDRVTEERINVYVTGEPPKITRFAIDSIYVHDKRGLLVDIDADQISRFAVRFRPIGSSAWSYKSDDRMTFGHSLVLTTNEVQAGVEYEVVAVVMNTSSDSTTSALTAILPDEAFPQRGFAQKPYALPPGYALDSVLAIPIGDRVAMSVFPNGINFGPLKIFTFNGSQFVQSDSLQQTWIPRSYGSTQTTATDLLIQADRFSELYRVGTGAKFLEQKIWESNRSSEFWGSTLADVDGNGLDEIVGKSSKSINNRFEDVYEVLAFRDNAFQSIATLTNPTSTEAGRSSNRFTEPNAAHADLDGDGNEELLVIDNDADIIVYTFKNGAFTTLFSEENNGSGEGSTVAFGDVNGDGRPDIIYAFHSSFDQNQDREYDPLYWTAKVLLNEDGTHFRNVYEDRFYYARPLNPYRSSVASIPNVTGRTSGENVVLSLFPNFYLLEWNPTIGTLEPVWHFPTSLSPRGALAFDFDRNGIREFGFVAGDSIRFFEREGNYAERPLAPGGLTATPLDVNSVQLDWGRVQGAQKYFILKAPEGSQSFDLIDSTTNTSYNDLDIAEGDTYFYSVIAIDDSKALRESPLAFTARAFIHPLPQIKRITPLKSQLRIVTTEALNKQSLSGAEFTIDDSIVVSSAVNGGDSVLVLTPGVALSPGSHTLRVTSWELRDIYNSPFDTAARFTFVQPTLNDDTAQFYAIRWRFEGGRRIHIEFNSMPNDEALDVQYYSLTPYGKLLRVYRDTADGNALYIDLDQNTKIVALGKPFVLCIEGISDVNGIEINPLSGNCLGVTLTEPDLTNIMVYPNPAKRTDRELMFARLTAEAEISIYTMDMKFIKRLSTTERNGGVRWDLRDENGEQLPSGIYLYYVTGKDDNGAEVEANTQKFVIIADQ